MCQPRISVLLRIDLLEGRVFQIVCLANIVSLIET